MAKDDDLEVFGASRADSEPSECSQEAVEKANTGLKVGGIAPGQHPRAHFRAPHADSVRR